MADVGISSAAAYVPPRRIARATIAAAHGWLTPDLVGRAKGTRAFANWDEDSITLAVEAIRRAVPQAQRATIDALYLASTTLPFADRHNAGVARTALNLPERIHSLDIGGSLRAGTSALCAALRGTGTCVVAAADRRKARPASTQELAWGDAAAALVVGAGDLIARCIGHTSLAVDFVDHFREAGADYDYVWEERWLRDEGYRKIFPEAVKALCRDTGIAPDCIAHAIFPLADLKTAQVIAKDCGLPASATSDTLSAEIGLTGTSHSLLMLVDVLGRAQPGELILVAGFGQGADVILLEATALLTARRPAPIASDKTITEDSYLRFLSFNAELPYELGMRAELDQRTALTSQYRNDAMITGFMAGRSRQTGVVQFPKTRVSVEPGHHTVDSFEDYPLAGEPAKILTHADDWLSYTPAPPFRYGHVQFDNGARVLMEYVDCGEPLDVGMPLRMVFRIKDFDTKRGYRRYFWKATPK